MLAALHVLTALCVGLSFSFTIVDGRPASHDANAIVRRQATRSSVVRALQRTGNHRRNTPSPVPVPVIQVQLSTSQDTTAPLGNYILEDAGRLRAIAQTQAAGASFQFAPDCSLLLASTPSNIYYAQTGGYTDSPVTSAPRSAPPANSLRVRCFAYLEDDTKPDDKGLFCYPNTSDMDDRVLQVSGSEVQIGMGAHMTFKIVQA